LIILTKVTGKSNMCDKFSEKSCSILHKLYGVIEQRRQNLPTDSYTTSLFLGGTEKVAAKFSEESQELIATVTAISPESGTKNNKNHIIHESADLMYHFLVLIASCHVTLDDVEQELARRFGVSGLTAKASRENAPPPP
jgi:phosphoribosyl-ATP pyrophosphohydrolase